MSKSIYEAQHRVNPTRGIRPLYRHYPIPKRVPLLEFHRSPPPCGLRKPLGCPLQTFEIYHGDFRQILNGLAGKAVITDPPYGVGLDYGGFVDNVEYVQSILPPLIEISNKVSDVLLFPSGQYEIEKWIFQNYPPRWRICWYKGAQSTASVIGFSDWEMIFVYGNNIHNFAHDYFFAKTAPADNGHPCPKSVAWARWLIEKFTNPGDTVIDPFMGSGTTGVACVELGRKFIGIDQSEKFCKIAENRIKNAQPALFTTMRQPNTASSGRVDSSGSPELFPAEISPSAKVTAKSTRR